MARPSKFTPRRRAQILSLLGAGKGIVATCKEAGICDLTLRTWRRLHPGFDEEVVAAIERGVDTQFSLATQALTTHLSQIVEGEVPYDHAAVKMALMRQDRAYGTTYAQSQVEHTGTVRHLLDEALAELDARKAGR